MSDLGEIVHVERVPEALYTALEEYAKEHRQEVQDMIRKAANRCRITLKATSPRGKEAKHYADGWSVKAVGTKYEATFTVYNSTKPGLAHLLNDGHVVVNEHGVYGFTRGDKHIDKAAKDAVAYLEEQLRKAGAL